MLSCKSNLRSFLDPGLPLAGGWDEAVMEKVPLEVDLVSEGCGAQILEVSRADFKVYTLTSFGLYKTEF